MKNFTKKEIEFFTTLAKLTHESINVISRGAQLIFTSEFYAEDFYFILKQIRRNKLNPAYHCYLTDFEDINKYSLENEKINNTAKYPKKTDRLVYILKADK